MKGNKGITLIALIITIIVLLILAGVSIAMLSGDNGMLNQSSKVIAYSAIGEVSDSINLKVNEYISSYYEFTYSDGTYIGETDPDSIIDAIDDALNEAESEYATETVDIRYNSSSSPKTIVITYGEYSKTGTVDEDAEAIVWGSIVKN